MRLAVLLQAAVSLFLLLLLWRLLDAGAVVERLGAIEPAWILAALVISLPQTLLSAERWRFTAGRLGVAMSHRRAWTEYYLAGLVNQLLPGGVAGDGLRVLRHAQSAAGTRPAYGPALSAAILERAAGYLALAPFALVGALLWLPQSALLWLALAAALTLLAIRPLKRLAAARRLGADAALALFAPAAFGRQLALSCIIFASYLLVFACTARAIGLALEPLFLLTAVPLVLLAMALPLSIAGWGLREAMSVLVFAAAGLPAEAGMAASVAYGLTILLAALPGLFVPLVRW